MKGDPMTTIPPIEPLTEAGRRLFTDIDPMDMMESNGVTWGDILGVEAEAAERAIHDRGADPLREVQVEPPPRLYGVGGETNATTERREAELEQQQRSDEAVLVRPEHQGQRGAVESPASVLGPVAGGSLRSDHTGLEAVVRFLDKYGLANTSGERHQQRRAALAEARAALGEEPHDQ